MKARLAVARALAGRGLKLFPLSRGKKRPAIKGWQDAATTDEATLEKWFSSDRFNIGVACGPSGLLVVDCDRKQEDGDANLRALAGEHVGDLDATFTVESPSGGRHYYFLGSVRDSVGKLARAVDIRSKGGLVAGPGSTNDKGVPYAVVNRAPVQPAPQWLLDAISQAYVVSEKVALATTVELDTEASLASAAAFLADVPPAVEGQGGNARTYKVACRVRDLGVSEFMAGSVMAGSWNDRCSPPWDDDELLEIVRNAYSYAENSPGSASPEFEFEEISDEALARIGNDHSQVEKATTGQYQYWTEDECDEENPADLVDVIDDVMPLGGFGAIIGKPGAGKSFLAIYLAHRISQGQPVFGRETEPRKVLYVASEDARGLRLRTKALRSTYGRGNLVVAGGYNNLVDKAERKVLFKKIKDEKFNAVVFDTLASGFPGIDENTTGGMGEVTRTCQALSNHGVTVFVVHHNAKAGGDASRGSGMFDAALDLRIFVEKNERSGAINAVVAKNRNNSDDWRLSFRLKTFEISPNRKGKMVKTAYVEEGKPGAKRLRLPPTMQAALDYLRALDEGGGALYDAWRSVCTDAPSKVSASENTKTRRRIFDRARDALVRNSMVEIRDGRAFLPGGAGDFEEIGEEPFSDDEPLAS